MPFVPPSPIIKPFCNSGFEVAPVLNTDPTVASQEIGFPPSQATPLNLGGVPVNIGQMNGIFNFYTNQILALVMGYQFTFDANISTEWGGYPAGFVLYCASNNSYQKSLVANNTANFITTPSYINDGIHWSAVIIDNIFAKTVTLPSAGIMYFYEATNTHYSSFVASSSQITDAPYVLPIGYPTASGYPIVSDTSGIMKWNSPKIDNLTPVWTGGAGVACPVGYTVVATLTVPAGYYDLYFYASVGAFSTLFDVGISTSNSTPVPSNFGQNFLAATVQEGNYLSISMSNYRIHVPSGSQDFYLFVNILGSPDSTNTCWASIGGNYAGPP